VFTATDVFTYSVRNIISIYFSVQFSVFIRYIYEINTSIYCGSVDGAHIGLLSVTVLPALPLSQVFRPTVAGTSCVVACTASSYRVLSVIARFHFSGLNGLENEMVFSPALFVSLLLRPHAALLGFRCPKFSGSCKVWAQIKKIEALYYGTYSFSVSFSVSLKKCCKGRCCISSFLGSR
jgi:hypothetical protein